MTHTLPLATITFPEIRLPQRAAAQLRGYFGTIFRQHSPLLHNHYDDGRTRYAYPLVQYKVIAGMPMLVGLMDGAKLLTDLFFQMKTLQISDREYPVMERDIAFKNATVGVGEGLYDYQFRTLWMPLNQQNYPEYLQKDAEARRAMLGRILTGNILSFFKGIGLFLPEGVRILSSVRPQEERLTGFKDQLMTGIAGGFTTNALLPDFIGLGKSVARGYGALDKSA
ncbi:MAG: DNA repair protein [Bacteroidetes bacterium]|nr:DNA repair protein [Bacteroidota bacterium]